MNGPYSAVWGARRLVGSRYRSQLLLIAREDNNPVLTQVIGIAGEQLRALAKGVNAKF